MQHLKTDELIEVFLRANEELLSRGVSPMRIMKDEIEKTRNPRTGRFERAIGNAD